LKKVAEPQSRPRLKKKKSEGGLERRRKISNPDLKKESRGLKKFTREMSSKVSASEPPGGRKGKKRWHGKSSLGAMKNNNSDVCISKETQKPEVKENQSYKRVKSGGRGETKDRQKREGNQLKNTQRGISIRLLNPLGIKQGYPKRTQKQKTSRTETRIWPKTGKK